MPSLGPLIPVRARWAGAVLFVGSLQFVLAMIAVQLAYPGYSDLSNTISDLGGPHSPWAAVFNGSIIVTGLLTFTAAVLLGAAFARKLSRTVGLAFLFLAGLGALLVGVFPEQTTALGGHAHGYAADLAFLASGVALVVLPLAMLRDTRWEGFRAYTFLSGVVTFVAIALYSTSAVGPLGVGGMERLIVAPILLWSIVVGVHLLRLPVYQRIPAAPHVST